MSRAVRVLPIPADEAWDLLADARNHARWVPLTHVVANGPVRVGTRIRAVSGPGARRRWPGFVDRMEITRADPPTPSHEAAAPDAPATPGAPRVAVYRKHGPVLLGEARIEVTALDECHARVAWSEDVYLAFVPPAVGRAILRPVLTLMTRVALNAAAREVQAAGPARLRP